MNILEDIKKLFDCLGIDYSFIYGTSNQLEDINKEILGDYILRIKFTCEDSMQMFIRRAHFIFTKP